MLNGIRSFLRDRLRLTKRLQLANASPAYLSSTLKGAAQLADRIAKSGPSEQRRILLQMLERIDVGGDRVGIVIRTDALRSMMSEGAPKQKDRKRAGQPEHTFTLDLPVSFRRRGVEMKLVITDERERLPAPAPHLIAAVAQGRQWFAQIRDGEVRSVRHLAERDSVNQGDVSRILPLGLLAPDIVEAILDGRQPIELTAKRLKRVPDLPISWAEQRRLLGFA